MSDFSEIQNEPGLRIQEHNSDSPPAVGQLPLAAWNDTAREYPNDKTIPALFRDQVLRTPQAVALELRGMRITYDELDRKSDHLAGHLGILGVAPGDRIGLYLERSLERIIGILGILKAGAAYWALEENLPEERLRFLIEDAAPKLVLTGENSGENLSGMTRIVRIEELISAPAAEFDISAGAGSPDEPAYVSYTSGSTGKPKGVIVPHRGVVRLVKGADYVSLTPEETLLHHSPLSFDASTFEIWGALLNGGRLVIMPSGPHSLSEISGVIREHRVTTLWLTAGLFHLMVDEKLDQLTGLRQLLAGGDVLSPQRVIKARRALPDCRIINGYGPTENTTFTCCYTVGDESELTSGVPIGRPIANTQVHILDDHMQPVPIGVAGELYAGGDGVACGYLNRPELTARRFVPDPFSREPEKRLYRTGDSARWRADGNIEFLGRLDNQLKIRGFRVEPGEIETALRACPGVHEAVLIWREDMPAGGSLVAYVVFQQSEIPAADLKNHLRASLPDYMIPAAFVTLDALPLTASGKLNRRGLPAPEFSSVDAPPDAGQPKDLLELELIRIWQRLFNRQDIVRTWNFFELGGHSLLAASLAAEIEKLVGIKLPIPTLFQSPTIELLAERLTGEKWLPPWSSLVPLQPHGTKPPLFLLHGWGGDVYIFLGLAQHLAPDQPVFGIQAVGLDGKVARHTDVQSMAAHYVREIRSFQPSGPYMLGGFSLGGMIAFEVAQQLVALDQKVSLLALFDSYPLGGVSWSIYARTMASHFCSRGKHHLRQWAQMPKQERRAYIQERWRAFKAWFAHNQSSAVKITSPPPLDSQPPVVPGFEDYYHALTAAYRLKRYSGTADVFVSDEAQPHELLALRNVVKGGMRFHHVPGTHYQILEPSHVEDLAEALKAVMAEKR